MTVENIFLAIHVVAGILFVGPVAVTTSLFPRYVPLQGPGKSPPLPSRSFPVALVLHRVTSTYALLALSVPVIGLMLAAVQDRIGEMWIIIAMSLTAIAGGLLALRLVPLQADTLRRAATKNDLQSLRMLTGIFNLLWVAVVVLMIIRPGSES